MDLSALLPQFQGNAETLLMGTALHFAAGGKVNTKHLDANAMAIGLFALAAQLEKENPGISERYGWAQIADLAAFSKYLQMASAATLPDGLH